MQSSLENTNELIFTIETNLKNVINSLEVLTNNEIIEAEVRYTDEYGYEKIAKLLNVENRDNKKILTFENFYTNKFNLIFTGDIAEGSIEDLKIVPLNQNEFYEEKDIDVRLDKSGLTAISLCGQYSNDAPKNAIDGNEGTVFHSATYTNYANHGDFVVQLGKDYLLDRLKLNTRPSGNGRIKTYEVLYRTSNHESWKKVFEQLTEESGVVREAVFKPVLASEICIRVTNGHNNFVFISELDIFKYNFIETRIKNLFVDEEETILKNGITLEEIENLLNELSTDSYKNRVLVAKELYILGLPKNHFSIPLNEEKIFDKLQFLTSERVLKVFIKYIDSYGAEKLIETEFETLGNIHTLNTKKIMTSSADLVVSGVSSVSNIFTNSYDISQFYINEDIDSRINSDKIKLSANTNVDASYPLSNLFDNNLNTQYRTSHYVDYEDVYLKLDKEYLIDRLRLISFRSPISGLVKKFKVLAKEMNTGEWIEIGENETNSHQNVWREIKGKPYLTDEICVRILDSENKWVILNEIELFIHNNLEKEIDDLFSDNSFEKLKDEVTYRRILDLEARVLVTREYKEKIDRAKALYIAKTKPISFNLEVDKKSVMNSFEILTTGKIYSAEVSYLDSYGYNKTANLLDNKNIGSEITLTFEHFYSDKFNLTIRGDIVESEIESIKIVKLNEAEFYESEDIDVRIDKNLMTAVSYCGQYSNNMPSNAIDGNTSTGFHSANYSEYGDFAIELDKPYLIDRLQMITRSSGNGRIKAYEILYRTSKIESWKKIFEQLTEESGINREAVFKPILASEICIRVTNGHGKFVLIYELDLFKYNSLEEKISNLFIDKEETTIKPGVSLEEIESLERELKTPSYRARVAAAKKIFIDGLLEKEFKIPLTKTTILDRIKFESSERISKVKIKYLDNYSVQKIIDVNCAAVGEEYVLSFGKISTENLSVLIYGAENIHSIVTNFYNLLDFCIEDDIDLRVPVQKIVELSTTNENSSYPISNIFDNNMDSQFHCSQYEDYCDVYFKLDKEYFIDGLGLKSYRSNESGLINKFKVLLKDMNSENTWTELGKYTVDLYSDRWLKVKGKPYLTNLVCLRIEDSQNKWALINELEIFIHSQLESKIDNLFSDDSFENLRLDVTYDEILELEKKVVITLEYREKVKKAKELYLNLCLKKIYSLNYKFDFVLDEIEVIYKTELNNSVDYKLEYTTTLGEKVQIEEFEIIQKSEKTFNIKFNRVLTKNIELTISYIDDSEAWKSSCIKAVHLDETLYYILDSRSLEYDKALITPISHCGVYSSNNSVENMLDGDSNTFFHSKNTGKVEFILKEPKVINEFWADISHPNGDNGRIYKAKFYYKEKEDGKWILIQNYENENPKSGINVFKFQNILAYSFCIDVEACYAEVVIFNEVGFHIYGTLVTKVNDLFVENTMFKVLKKEVTLKKVEELKILAEENDDLKIKLEIASLILKNNGEFPLKVQTYKAIEKDSSYYFGTTASNNTGDISLSNHYIEPNTDYVFVLNRDVEAALMTYTGKPSSNKVFLLKKGINIVNVPEQGQMIFKGSRKEEIEYYSLNNENALVYRYGHTKSRDFFNKKDIKNELEKDHDSNLAYIEGKTYIGAVSFEWLKANFENKNLSKHVEIFDEYLDFIHYLDNVTGHFKQQMPYKRLLWCGRGEDTYHAGGSFIGGYTAYYGSSSPMVPNSTYDLANSWAVGHEIGHELDSNDYIMGLFGEVTNNWFAEQPRQEYMKTIRTKENVKNIGDNPYSVYDMGFFDRLAFFYKMRLFYKDNSFFQKMNSLMQSNRASTLEEAADNFAKFSTRILKRDMSAYYLKYGFTLSEDAINWCKQYPAPAIDLQHITWENYEEFIKEEVKLFNQKYKSALKIK
ncbi:MAG: discoidin domain-containing protein [Cetobacterium sp.]